jgi:hypothetical protein
MKKIGHTTCIYQNVFRTIEHGKVFMGYLTPLALNDRAVLIFN